MKKVICTLLAVILLSLTLTATVNADIVNKEPIISIDEALADHDIDTFRVYFHMPDTWYSDYSVYEGKYYAGVYWWENNSAPAEFPGYRMMIDNYAQGVYYADIPEETYFAIFNNGFGYVYDSARPESEKAQQAVWTRDVDLGGALPGDYATLPEGSPDAYSFDGCIYVIDQDTDDQNDGRKLYEGSWYVYYSEGCYGSYAETSDRFTTIADNCLNPAHFDSEGHHIGGAQIETPFAPAQAPADESLNGYYLVNGREPETVRSENKLYPSADGEYTKYCYIEKDYRFKIVQYQDGIALSESAWYPAEGYYNDNDTINGDPSGAEYMLYFRPDGSGDSSYIDGCLKVVALEEHPTELATEPDTPAEPPYLYRDRFEQAYEYETQFGAWSYKELYYHYDENGETDWALVYAFLPLCSPMPVTEIIGHRVVSSGSWYQPFRTCYGIYDAEKDEFIDAASLRAQSYDDFTDVFDTVGTGRLLGDVDNDGDLNVIDATIIQRCEANLRSYPDGDSYTITSEWSGQEHYYSDFNRDGERDILDVTSIQRHLVKMG